MQLNRGRFAENGNCGYVLKSPALLGEPGDGGPVQLDVTVLSCQRVPGGGTARDIVDPYVVVEVCRARERAYALPREKSSRRPRSFPHTQERTSAC
jgi:hypothetical protein